MSMEGAEWSAVQMRDVMSAVKQVRPGSSVLVKSLYLAWRNQYV